MVQSLHIFGDEGAPACRLTKLLQRLPVNPSIVLVADPYGVYNYFGAQRIFDGFRPLGKARGVVTIDEEDDSLSHRFLDQHVRAAGGHRVVDRSYSFAVNAHDGRRPTA